MFFLRCFETFINLLDNKTFALPLIRNFVYYLIFICIYKKYALFITTFVMDTIFWGKKKLKKLKKQNLKE